MKLTKEVLDELNFQEFKLYDDLGEEKITEGIFKHKDKFVYLFWTEADKPDTLEELIVRVHNLGKYDGLREHYTESNKKLGVKHYTKEQIEDLDNKYDKYKK